MVLQLCVRGRSKSQNWQDDDMRQQHLHSSAHLEPSNLILMFKTLTTLSSATSYILIGIDAQIQAHGQDLQTKPEVGLPFGVLVVNFLFHLTMK